MTVATRFPSSISRKEFTPAFKKATPISGPRRPWDMFVHQGLVEAWLADRGVDTSEIYAVTYEGRHEKPDTLLVTLWHGGGPADVTDVRIAITD